MAIIEIEYSGLQHTVEEPEALPPAFDCRELKAAITAILPPEAVWELEAGEPDETDNGFDYYGVRYGENFMPVFFWDDGNRVEYEPGTAWGELVLAILELMEAAARKNAESLGVEPEPLRTDGDSWSKSEPVEVLVIDFDWKF